MRRDSEASTSSFSSRSEVVAAASIQAAAVPSVQIFEISSAFVHPMRPET